MTHSNLSVVASTPDRELIAKAQRGDAGAFSEITIRYQPRLVRTAIRIVNDEHDAEDVVQQALTSAWLNFEKFRGEAALSTWLTRIVMNEAFTFRRRRKMELVELDEQSTDSNATLSERLASNTKNPEERLLQRETTRLLRESLKEIKPAYRPAMQLRLIEDLSVEEIAGRLDVPVNTVKVHLFRARKSMKSFLEENLRRAA
jgi:RNA polymerase sigma-70 factor (ECF subfamily)